VIWTATGIVALAGIIISAFMGMFSVGIGFVAGMELTGEITLVLAAVALIFNAIEGQPFACFHLGFNALMSNFFFIGSTGRSEVRRSIDLPTFARG
jgi:hypothetical protein